MWQLFSIVAALLPLVGYTFTPGQLFTLVALPPLIGATMRFPYTFAVGIFGGRNWTVISALLLLIPTVMLGVIIQNPETPFWLFAVAAALGGFGGGNFSSSMANIGYFYPRAKKGAALGINAAGGGTSGSGSSSFSFRSSSPSRRWGRFSAEARRLGRTHPGRRVRCSSRMRRFSGCR